MFGAKDKNVWLDTGALQFLDRVLSGFCLQLACRSQVGNVRQVYTQSIFSQFPLQLADTFQIGERLDVADGSADFGDDEVEFIFIAEQLDVTFDFVRDMRNDLNGFSQIVAPAFLVDDTLVDAAGRDVVGLGRLDTQKRS